jgi:hypothetical protein
MKYTAYLLALAICFMALQPAVSKVYALVSNHSSSCEMACCKNKASVAKEVKSCCKGKHEKKTSTDSCCDKGLCNPFGLCSCCFMYSSERNAHQFFPQGIISKLNRSFTGKAVSDYLADCFHPPEIV